MYGRIYDSISLLPLVSGKVDPTAQRVLFLRRRHADQLSLSFVFHDLGLKTGPWKPFFEGPQVLRNEPLKSMTRRHDFETRAHDHGVVRSHMFTWRPKINFTLQQLSLYARPYM
eukprot:COSAG05_NODE_842_length_7020_cov_16.612484_4_plen_114_part_00